MSAYNTVTQLQGAIGRSTHIRRGELYIEVLIRDVRNVWGKVQVCCVPVAGAGSAWVDLSSVVISQTLPHSVQMLE